MSNPYTSTGYGHPQEHPNGTAVLVLGIVGIFVTVCAPIAWYLGNRALADVTAGGGPYTNESQIRTGRMLGKIFTILAIIGLLLGIIFGVLALVLAASQS